MRRTDSVPPGKMLLEDFLKPMGITKHRLARSIKVLPSRIYGVVHGKRPINAELALRLRRFFGTDARSWINLAGALQSGMWRDRVGGECEDGDQATCGLTEWSPL